MRTIAVLVVLLAIVRCNQTSKDRIARHPIEIAEIDEDFLVTEAEQEILFYQRKLKSLDREYTRPNYVHPLYGLDGQILTEDFPADNRQNLSVTLVAGGGKVMICRKVGSVT